MRSALLSRALRTLARNAAAATFALVALGGVSITGSWRGTLLNLAISFLFANCIGLPLGVALSSVGPYVWPRFGFPTNWILLIAMMVVLAVGGSALAITILMAIGVIASGSFGGWFLGSIRISLLATLTFGIVGMIYEGMRRRLEQTTLELRTKERDEAEARRLAAQARLGALEARVQPHFLFNTLNSIAALIPVDPVGAERVVGRLSSLLRASLDTTRPPLVSLADELRLVQDYLEIEHIRFGDRLRYELPHTNDVAGIMVPRLAIQTLVENSVKHAVGGRREGARIRVSAARIATGVLVTVEDDGPGFSASAVPSDHGLALVKDRLTAMSDAARLRIDGRPGRCVVELDLPTSVTPI